MRLMRIAVVIKRFVENENEECATLSYCIARGDVVKGCER